MRLGKHTNGISCEIAMQDAFPIWLASIERKTYRKIYYSYECFPEVYISEVKRRPDFLLLSKNKLINVEAKSNNFDHLITQMVDNSLYCDYSFAFIPDYSMTSEYFKHQLTKYRFGLIIYNHATGQITEVLEAHHNNGLDKTLKKIVIKKLKESLPLKRKS